MFVAVCPHPPLLVPQLDPHGLAELAPVRTAARDAVRWLLASGPDVVTVLVSGDEGLDRDETAGGDLGVHGVPVAVGGPAGGLPQAAMVGAWLLDDAGWTGRRRHLDTGSARAVLADGAAQALLVMADGTACRSERAPGHLDERAEAFDAAIAAALASGDAATLSALDLELAAELQMAGGPSLVAFGEQVQARVPGAGDVVAQLRHESAPFGVGYWVATWRVG